MKHAVSIRMDSSKCDTRWEIAKVRQMYWDCIRNIAFVGKWIESKRMTDVILFDSSDALSCL
jgi:hypothetical protein